MSGEQGRRRVVEGQRGGQNQPGCPAQPVAQLDCGQRIDAEVPECPVGSHRGRAGTAEHDGGLRADQLGNELIRLGMRQPAQLRGQALTDGGAGQGCGLGHAVEESRHAKPRPESVPGQLGDGVSPLVEGPAQRRERDGGFDRDQPALAELPTDLTVRHTVAGPRAPRDGCGGAARRPIRVDQCVHSGVGGRIVALPLGTDHSSDRGEGDERVQIPVAGQLVQGLDGVDLGPGHCGESVRCQGVDQTVVEHAGDVDHCGQREISEQIPHGGRVGGVRAGDGGGGAQGRQLRHEISGAGRPVAAPAGEDQVIGALRGEPPGDVDAERTSAAGDEHGPAGLPVAASAGGVHEAAAVRSRVPNRDLILPAAERRGEALPPVGAEFGGDVDEAAPAVGVLHGGAPAESPQHGLPGRCDLIRSAGTAGDTPQGRGEGGVAERLHKGGERDGAGEGLGRAEGQQ